ncbi:endolytic transglycosylase MltG [Bacteroidales bacterium OttesenSCG-928-B11]|nr:endolytic transglycosylase MltG [Bacteroidales bacterium OttesenSCG-928-E04]MDL2312854.1 endolytic transglycosylase MltG [Bacteroidales bacterium OttesenSCG-928-B11]MDL2325856.1 endolytic transglycosylase MltG [Bacteroidales bacterium OttesenSCG-928-A14]
MPKEKSIKNKKRIVRKICISIVILFFTALASVFFLFAYPNSAKRSSFLHIPKGATYQDVQDSLKANKIIENNFSFNVAAKLLKYNRQILSGKYIIEPGQSNYKIIRFLQRGQHYPVKFTFNNIRTKQQFVEKVGNRFLFDPKDLEKLLNDNYFLAKYGLTPDNCFAIFFPDTYELYYDITAEEFFEKFYGYYTSFWTDERKNLADNIGISPLDVSTIASIVEEENHKGGEKKMISGVYINRIQKGWPLQADPTLKFAHNDFAITRVLDKHKEIDSPYNTYMYDGIPPGPIRIPEKSTLDSVLHYTHHSYMYMCAKYDFSGNHSFARTLDEHNYNAYRYRKALDQAKIYR